ncbi:MAG TPA: DUF2071 domain-containing protein [Chthonomonadaceae bacterium]|nr:DUF2071 domain-containing protein [Chthonomonadaceae bacterium]
MTAVPSRPDPIDRITPTRLPSDRTVMYQRWAHLLFLHWAIPPETLQSLIPPGLDLDTFEGQAYVGLVPFTMMGVRPVGVPALPGLSAFHETNVRTYVHRMGRDPGVWFFSLDAANALAVRVARALWKLPYHFARMALEFSPKTGSIAPEIRYQSERLWPGPHPAACALSYTPTGTPAPAQAGTLEHFLIERYILYSTAHGRLYQGRVHHAPYPVQSATVHALDESLLAAAGIARPNPAPLVHYASEVRVRIYPLHALAT